MRRIVDVERQATTLDRSLHPRFLAAFRRQSRWHASRRLAQIAAFVAFVFAAPWTVEGIGRLVLVEWFGLSESASKPIEFGAFVTMLVSVVVAMIGVELGLRARCPYCACDVDALGRFCPKCGERSLLLRPKPHCGACGLNLTWGKFRRDHPRQYRVHHCSACGLLLCPAGFE